MGGFGGKYGAGAQELNTMLNGGTGGRGGAGESGTEVKYRSTVMCRSTMLVPGGGRKTGEGHSPGQGRRQEGGRARVGRGMANAALRLLNHVTQMTRRAYRGERQPASQR